MQGIVATVQVGLTKGVFLKPEKSRDVNKNRTMGITVRTREGH